MGRCIKLFIGSVCVALITQIASCHVKTVEFKASDQSLEREFLNKHFEDIIDPKKKDSRLLLAQYCASVFGGRWAQSKDLLEMENKKVLEAAPKIKMIY
jgi:hypothetical protein